MEVESRYLGQIPSSSSPRPAGRGELLDGICPRYLLSTSMPGSGDWMGLRPDSHHRSTRSQAGMPRACRIGGRPGAAPNNKAAREQLLNELGMVLFELTEERVDAQPAEFGALWSQSR